MEDLVFPHPAQVQFQVMFCLLNRHSQQSVMVSIPAHTQPGLNFHAPSPHCSTQHHNTLPHPWRYSTNTPQNSHKYANHIKKPTTVSTLSFVEHHRKHAKTA